MSNVAAYLEAAKQVVDLYDGVKTIVSDGRPVLTSNDIVACAVPQGADPMSMPAAGTNVHKIVYDEEWEIPYITSWSTKATVKIAWAYGARYKGGGAYIPAVFTWCEDSDLSTGQDFTVTFEAGSPYTQGDENAPYAVLPVKVHFHEESVVDSFDKTYQYLLYGYGGEAQRL
ncbi:MAG: hypothetical protein AB7L84_06560 [Acidimicrobiia bacterium]